MGAQVPLHGAFAFTTLTCVFTEDYEVPAVAVHGVGAACCLGLLWQVGACLDISLPSNLLITCNQASNDLAVALHGPLPGSAVAGDTQPGQCQSPLHHASTSTTTGLQQPRRGGARHQLWYVIEAALCRITAFLQSRLVMTALKCRHTLSGIKHSPAACAGCRGGAHACTAAAAGGVWRSCVRRRQCQAPRCTRT